jgi:hypothetical protein
MESEPGSPDAEQTPSAEVDPATPDANPAKLLWVALSIAAGIALLVYVIARVLVAQGNQVPAQSPLAATNAVAVGFQPLALEFLDHDHGLIAGSVPCDACEAGVGGLIAATSDAGRSWTVRFRSDRPILRLAHVGQTSTVLASASNCDNAAFIGCDLKALRSTDLGQTWTASLPTNHYWLSPPPLPVPCHPDHPYAVSSSFPTPDRGWVFCGYKPTSASYQFKGLYATDDGGRRWRELPEFHPVGGATVNPSNMPVQGFAWGASFLGDGHGWMWTINKYSTLSSTANGGKRWTRIWTSPRDSGRTLLSASLLTPASGYVLTWDAENGAGLLATDDGGLHWDPVQSWSPQSLPLLQTLS